MNGTDRMSWRQHFADILLSGDKAEVEAATDAALAALARGGDRAAANAAGKAAAKRYRESRGAAGVAGGFADHSRASPGGGFTASDRAGGPGPATGSAQPSPSANALDWPRQLAPRLFDLPARWGWQAAPLAARAATHVELPPPRPQWVEPPHPDTGALRATRTRAVTRLTWRLAFTVVLVGAFTTYRFAIEEQVAGFGSSAGRVYSLVVLVAAGLLALGVVRSLAALNHANRNIRDFERPYLTMRTQERQRHDAALREWDEAVRRHAAAAQEAERAAASGASGPRWYPVRPVSQPIRIDVLGGDIWRHGWASLLVTFGTSVLTTGQQVTVLDLTGQDVAGGLVAVAAASGRRTRWTALSDEGSDLDLLAGVPRRELPECLAVALLGRPSSPAGGDQRQERALASDVLTRVVRSLDPPLTFARLAGAVGVLRQSSGDGVLTTDEVTRLAGQVADLDRTEWATRHLGFLANQLDVLARYGRPSGGLPLWTDDPVSVIATPGDRDDHKELLDRMLVQLAQIAMQQRGPLSGVLAVAGADHLGGKLLRILSDHARIAGVRLILMIDQPQDDLEKAAGTGGAVCLMKMYNHRDAAVAAEFIGRGHKFVVNQVTRQVSKSFSDGGNDNFGASTGQSGSRKQWRSGLAGRPTGLSDNRGHTWSASRTWQTGDTVGTTTGSQRVYEFEVEPREIMGMPETAFILVDNSSAGRRVVMADANPGICLLDRVASTPIEGS
ncbi:hypothetical protein [Rugosimonospora africana]|uniref:hypothetical protein n=1 Tax=Rugosimonospora africana TaxID=556532 RepID=UPI00194426E7|nr:hypothetical protein [Rugosimonospora africana]